MQITQKLVWQLQPSASANNWSARRRKWRYFAQHRQIIVKYFCLYCVRAMEKHVFKQLYGVLPCVKPVQRVTFLLSHSTQQQVEIEQTRFLSTEFLCTEFKLENIYSGLNFCTKNVWGIFFFGSLFLPIARKIAKIRTQKVSAASCNTVSEVCKLCLIMLAVRTVTRLRTRLILIYAVFILTCSHAIKNDTACSITMCPICVEWKFTTLDQTRPTNHTNQLAKCSLLNSWIDSRI